jgi:hypothetical protein
MLLFYVDRRMLAISIARFRSTVPAPIARTKEFQSYRYDTIKLITLSVLAIQ